MGSLSRSGNEPGIVPSTAPLGAPTPISSSSAVPAQTKFHFPAIFLFLLPLPTSCLSFLHLPPPLPGTSLPIQPRSALPSTRVQLQPRSALPSWSNLSLSPSSLLPLRL